MDRIDILLGTYNGAEFLDQQLNSIAAQTHGNWRLIARDDGSTDRTMEILIGFQARHPDKVVVVEDGDGNLGLMKNFSRLMEGSDAPYAAFCDQDDVWVPEKLELSLARTRELERDHGAEVPLLVFTDLEVVDENLQTIHESFWRSQGLKPERCNLLNRLLLQNVVTGCTVLMNRALLRKAAPIHPAAEMHDWWVALTAAAFGVAGFVSRPTVRYRQHGQNIVGARSMALAMLPQLMRQFFSGYSTNRRKILNRFVRGSAFLESHAETLSAEQRRLLEAFLKIPDGVLVQRLIGISRLRVSPTGLWRLCLYALLSSGADRRGASE